MTIGYMTVEINEKGEPRIKKDSKGNELLTILDVNFAFTTEIQSEALEMIRAHIPKELKDVLVIFTFKYESHGGGYFRDDYEDWLVVESQLVLKEQYKEFYCHQVTRELELSGGMPEVLEHGEELSENEKELKEALDLVIGEWEEFYDEDFTPTVVEKVAVSPLQYFGQ